MVAVVSVVVEMAVMVVALQGELQAGKTITCTRVKLDWSDLADSSVLSPQVNTNDQSRDTSDVLEAL